MDNKKLAIKIAIPILILAVIVGIYFLKTNAKLKIENKEGEIPFEVTSINLDELKKYNKPIIIDFGSDSCAPCRQMYPDLVKVNKKMQGKAIVQFIDVWQNSDAVKDFPIQSIPTQVFYTSDGKPFKPSDSLLQELQFLMYKSKETDEHILTMHQGGLNEEQMLKILAEMGVK